MLCKLLLAAVLYSWQPYCHSVSGYSCTSRLDIWTTTVSAASVPLVSNLILTRRVPALLKLPASRIPGAGLLNCTTSSSTRGFTVPLPLRRRLRLRLRRRPPLLLPLLPACPASRNSPTSPTKTYSASVSYSYSYSTTVRLLQQLRRRRLRIYCCSGFPGRLPRLDFGNAQKVSIPQALLTGSDASALQEATQIPTSPSLPSHFPAPAWHLGS